MKTHWMTSANLIYWNEQDRWLLGEDDRADWWVPHVPTDMRPYWDRFCWWNPLHWICYLNSRRRNEVVFLDWETVEHDTADPAAWSRGEQ